MGSPIRPIRTTCAILALVLSASVCAQAPAPKLEPVPEPPPAIGLDQDSSIEHGVRLSPRGDEIIEESIKNGFHTVRVRTASGWEYVLVEDLGDGQYARQRPHDSGVRIPMWVIRRF